MVKTKHGTFEVRSITFGERRELHRIELKANKDGTIDPDGYFNLLEFVMNKAFEKPAKTLEKFDDNEVDEILNDIYMHYKGLSKKKNLK